MNYCLERRDGTGDRNLRQKRKPVTMGLLSLSTEKLTSEGDYTRRVTETKKRSIKDSTAISPHSSQNNLVTVCRYEIGVTRDPIVLRL